MKRDPDIDQAAEAATGTYQKTAVSLSDPSDTREVTFDQGSISVEGVPDAEVLILSTIPVITSENMALAAEPCEDVLPGEPLDLCLPSDPGPGPGDAPDDPEPPQAGPFFPASFKSTTYLGLRALRTDSHGDHGPNLEVQMHIQGSDDYSRQFSKRNRFRFDTAYFTHTVTTLFGSHSADDFVVYGYPGGPAAGTANSQNAVVFPEQRYTRYFQTPDVNHDNTTYDFTNLSADDWPLAVAVAGGGRVALAGLRPSSAFICRPTPGGRPLSRP